MTPRRKPASDQHERARRLVAAWHKQLNVDAKASLSKIDIRVLVEDVAYLLANPNYEQEEEG